jgi:hypothetical protein
MKVFRNLVGIAALVFGVSFTVAQSVNPAKVKINGVIGLSSTYQQVVKALGNPASETSPRMEQCTGGHEKTVRYAGLTFYFMSGISRDGKTFEVEGFMVSSPKWPVSGAKVGDTEAVIRRRFGSRFAVGKDPQTGAKTWSYEKDESTTTVAFKNGKVVSITSSLQVC